MKQVNARVLLKHDTVDNWKKIQYSFIPMDGEMIVYDDYAPIWEKNTDGTYVLDSEGNKVQKYTEDKYGNLTPVFMPGLKIGTGQRRLAFLPFITITPDIQEKMESWKIRIKTLKVVMFAKDYH